MDALLNLALGLALVAATSPAVSAPLHPPHRPALLGLSAPIAARAGQDAAMRDSVLADVRGVVVDSTADAPLPGARVMLWGTLHEDTSDEEGRFRIRDVPPGEYSLVFFHPRLTALGVASGGRPITIESADVEVALGVPSRFTLLVARCAGVGGVAVAGQAFDQRSGLALAGADVDFHWLDASGTPARRWATSEASGWYHACGLPPGVPVAVSASFLDRQALRREVVAPEGASVRLRLPLAQLRPASVSATVLDAGAGAPLPGALVRLGISGPGLRAVSDDDGRVAFEGVAPGRYTLTVEHLARATRTDVVDVPSGLDVTLRLDVASEPIPLPPIDVMVEDFEETLGMMGGIEITSADIDAVRARSRDLGELLRTQHIPGVVVSRDFNGQVCVEFLNGQVNLYKPACEPLMVVLDGVRLGYARDVFTMAVGVIESMRLLRPIDAGTLFGLGSSTGVLLITTRSRN